MKYALWKNIFREIKNTFGRFLSILLMISVGVMIFVGLKVTGPFLGEVAKHFLTETKTAHITVSSNYDLDEEDQKILKHIKGIDTIEFGYKKDFAIEKTHHPVTLMSKNKSLSLTKVTEGRVPKNDHEILLDTSMKLEGYKIGDMITFQKDEEDSLTNYQFRVVGFGNHSSFLQIMNKGSAIVGTGRIKGFGLIQKDVFQSEDYQLAMYRFQDMKNVDLLSPKYTALSNKHRDEIEDKLSAASEDKMRRVHQKIEDKISDGDQKVKDAEKEIADAEKKLADGRRELDDGFAAYQKNKNLFDEKIQDAASQLDAAKRKIADGKKELAASQNLLQRSQAQYDEGYSTYLKNKATIDAKDVALKEGYDKIRSAQKQLDQEMVRLQNALSDLEQNKKSYRDGMQKYQTEKQKLDAAYKEYEKAWTAFHNQLPTLQQQSRQLADSIAEKETILSDLTKEYDEKSTAIEEKKAQQQIYRDEITALENDSELLSIKNTIDMLQNEIALLKEKLATAPEEEKPGIQAEIEEKQNALTAANNQYAKRRTEIDTKIAERNNKISTLQQEIDAISLPDLGPVKAEIDALQKQKQKVDDIISETTAQLSQTKARLDQGKTTLAQTEQQLKEAYHRIQQGQIQISNGMVQVRLAKEQLALKQLELQDGFAQLSGAKTMLEGALEELTFAKRKLDLGYEEFNTGKAQLTAAQNQYTAGISALEENRRSGISQLQTAYQKLLDGQIELSDKQKEFDEKLPDAEKEISDAKKDLKKARDQKSILIDPIYQIVPIKEAHGIYEFFDMTSRLAIISNIFPLFFFLISILVSMTTLTRMVDESREQMGMLKALGYGKFDILLKFVIYAFLASLLGGILGVIFGHAVIGVQIAGAYTGDFIFDIHKIDFNAYYSILGILIGIVCTVTVSFVVAYRTLQKAPAVLMRKKAPAKGSRILLERLTPLWNRLSFIQKVTARNIFRYKKRMLMTIFGVAGCIGLLIMGIGIQNSLNGVLEHQFGEIFKYDYIIVSEEKIDRNQYKKFRNYLASDEVKTDFPLRVESAYISIPNKKNESIAILATDQKDSLDSVVSLKDRKTKKNLSLSDDGVIVTETTANIYDLKKGDTLNFHDAYHKPYQVKVTGITENYTGHYIYMTDSLYEKIYQKTFEKNADLVHITKNSAGDITKKLLENDTVVSLIEVNTLKDTLKQSLDSLNILVLVIVVCACVLAFVVLYNLNNINISERKLELSTIKVLGFYDKEVTAYIYRETVILSFIGILFGFGVGRIMHGMIITKLIPYILMLNPDLKITNFILSTVITVVFTFIVMLIIHHKLQKINMIEALKED